MPTFKTERAKVLHADKMPIERKVCFAANDYKYALANPGFAVANGCTVEQLRDDLFLFLDQWAENL